MSTSEQITRIQTARNSIRTKLVEMGLAESTAQIDVLATAVEGIANNGSVSAEVKEGETYTIPKGYHNGSGTVSGVAGGGNYTLQSKTVTPTKSEQNIVPDAGSYGLSDVTVAAIPEAYQDVTSVTAGAGDVLANKIIVDATGKQIAGTMANNGAVAAELDVNATSYTVPAGYHNGSGTVKITTETKSATPTKAEQTIEATDGKVLSAVTVAAIPDAYQDVTSVTATADKVLTGSNFVDATGAKVAGTMVNNGKVDHVLTSSGDDSTFTIPQGYHDGTGSVTVNVENPETIVPTKSEQVIDGQSSMVFFDSVVVAPIPDAYQDVTGVTATADKVLTGSTFVDSIGKEVAGTMKNNGAVNLSMDGLTTTSVTIPAGYTTGGTVTLTDDIETMLAAI